MYPHIHLHVLASGSKGNAAVVEGPKGSILIDCGISRRELLRRAGDLGVDMGRVSALLLTHEHSDHVAGIPVFAKHFGGTLVATAGTVSGSPRLAGLSFDLVGHSDSFDVAGMHVQCFPTSHDVGDPMGFRFSVHGPYPAFLRARVGSDTGHLSNAQCAEALPLLVGPDTETVVALHLSEKNNRPGVCVRTLAAAVGAEVLADNAAEARSPDGTLTVRAASQTTPLSVW